MYKIIFSIILAFAPLGAMAAAKVGEPAPNFTITDTNGKEFSIEGHKGKIVVLEWTNHECPFVVKHYSGGNMQGLQKKYTDKGVHWVSVISSAPGKQGHISAEKANELTASRDAHPIHVILDEDGAIGQAYGAKTTPHMFIVNAEGLLAYEGAIDDKPSTNAADISGAKNYVSQALDELLAGKEVSEASTGQYGCSVKY